MEHRMTSAPMGRYNTESDGSFGYTFAGFSAADVLSFRSPFAYTAVADRLCVSFLDMAVRTAEDMDFVEGLETCVRESASCPAGPGELLSALDGVVDREGRQGEVAIFSCRFNAPGTLLYATAGQSALLVDQHGCIRTVTDTTLPLGTGPGRGFQSQELPLRAAGVLVVFNQLFQREMDMGSLRAILLQSRERSAITIRDRIAEQWARSEAALRHCQSAAMFVLKPSSASRHSRHEGAFGLMVRLGRSLSCPGQRAYGTLDFDFWAPPPVAEAASAVSRVA